MSGQTQRNTNCQEDLATIHIRRVNTNESGEGVGVYCHTREIVPIWHSRKGIHEDVTCLLCIEIYIRLGGSRDIRRSNSKSNC